MNVDVIYFFLLLYAEHFQTEDLGYYRSQKLRFGLETTVILFRTTIDKEVLFRKKKKLPPTQRTFSSSRRIFFTHRIRNTASRPPIAAIERANYCSRRSFRSASDEPSIALDGTAVETHTGRDTRKSKFTAKRVLWSGLYCYRNECYTRIVITLCVRTQQSHDVVPPPVSCRLLAVVNERGDAMCAKIAQREIFGKSFIPKSNFFNSLVTLQSRPKRFSKDLS